jgi:hypothetical protein
MALRHQGPREDTHYDERRIAFIHWWHEKDLTQRRPIIRFHLIPPIFQGAVHELAKRAFRAGAAFEAKRGEAENLGGHAAGFDPVPLNAVQAAIELCGTGQIQAAVNNLQVVEMYLRAAAKAAGKGRDAGGVKEEVE